MIFIFLKPLKLSKNKAKVCLLIVIIGIWGYALLTGMSPSIVRAAIIFTLLTLGPMRECKPSIYNILAFSAMLTIVVNPDVIHQVGFQLSYLSVLGIVLIQPLLVRIWIPKRRVVKYFWQLSTVSFAAQLVTFPLSVYYFHVFPTYFLTGNLLIIPLVFLIMNVSVPLLFLGWIPVLGDMIGWLLSKLILFQNWLTFLIQTISAGKIDRLTFDFVQILVIWLLLLVIVSWELGSKKKLIRIAFLLLTFGLFYSIYMEASRPVNQLVTYVGKSGRLFDLVIDCKLYFWNTGMTASEVSFMIDANRIQNHWPQIPEILHSILSSNNEVEWWVSGLKAIMKEDLLQFDSPSLIRMEVWQQGTWKTISNRAFLKMEPDEAYRFLF
jgi:competence protein ComEC